MNNEIGDEEQKEGMLYDVVSCVSHGFGYVGKKYGRKHSVKPHQS